MRLRGTLILIALFWATWMDINAEGTKQLSPTDQDVVLLHTNAQGFGGFGAYDGDPLSRLNVHIADFNNEVLYIGMSAEADNDGNINSSFWFRIKDPDGNIVHGPFQVTTGNQNCETWDLAEAGPDVLDPTGYSTAAAYAVFDPSTVGVNGDYYIEFSELATAPQNNIVNVKWFDFTVVSGGAEQLGRIWSNKWALRTPEDVGNAPDCEWDRPFNGEFYSYTAAGFVSRIDFNDSGFQPLSFIVAFGENGPGTTGDIVEDRKSTNQGDSTATAADHMVFVSEPDAILFPSSDTICGDAELLGISCIGDSICIEVGVTRPGQVEILLDFFGDNGIFDPNSEDVFIAQVFDVADTACIIWDKKKGDGSELSFDEPVIAVIRYSQGVQHYAAFDVEFLKDGFCVETVRPVCQGQSNLLYWDDSEITDFINTPAIDESDPGTGQPLVQLNGCSCGVGGCRTWDNFQTGADPNDCDGAPAGYGNERTLNTWWFAASIVIGPFDLPIVRAMAIGDTLICEGDSTELTVQTNPDSLSYEYTWTGPGGFSANTQSAGFVTEPGTYVITILDAPSNCFATDSITLELSEALMTDIMFTCVGQNQTNADVDLTVTGGIMPYTYLWSTGDMTEDLTDVAPGTYTVTVTDDLGCEGVDTVLVEGCCTLDVTCPPVDGGVFSCATDIPAADTTLIIVNDFCTSVAIMTFDQDNGATGCADDTLVVTRMYSITDGAGNSAMCEQIFMIVDDVAPMVADCPADVSVQCGEPIDEGTLGEPTYTDNCSSPDAIAVTFADDSTGFDGTCTAMVLGEIQRTFYAEDPCGNIDSSCVQTIFIIDTVPPTFTTPADIVIDCTEDPDIQLTGDVSDDMDDCTVTSVSFSDLTVAGECPAVDTVYRTWTVTDICGNESTDIQVITRTDTSPPTFDTPADISIECTQDSFPSTTGDVTNVIDDCSSFTVEFSDVIAGTGSCPVVDTIFRTWTVTDDCNNASTDLQIITRVDLSPPSFTVPADITIECDDSTDPATTGDVTDLSDECSTPIVDYVDVETQGQCPEVLLITRTWTAEDECGNSASAVQMITTIDTVPPVVTPGTCPADVTIACLEDAGNFGEPMFTDNCSMAMLMFEDDSIGFVPPSVEGQIERTFYITDACGNVDSSCVQTIFVVDTIPPALTCPSNVTVDCGASIDTADLGVPVFTDNCGAADGVTIQFSDDSLNFVDMCNAGDIRRTFIITDADGNMSTCAQTITVVDAVAPTFDVPGDILVDCTDDLDDLTLLGNVSNVMDCSGIADTVYSDSTGMMDCSGMGEIFRTWTISDGCGNEASDVQIIMVQDTVPPVLESPDDVTITCEQDPQDTSLTGSVIIISDDCSMMFMLEYQDDTTGLNGCNGTGVIIRSWNASDDCDNMTVMEQLITIIDTTPPVPLCQDITLDFDLDLVFNISADAIDAGSMDNCGAVSLSLSQSNFDCRDFVDQPMMPVTLTVSDECGNTSTCAATVTGEGGKGIDLICPPGDIYISLESGFCEQPVNYSIGASPLCGTREVILEQIDTSGFTTGDNFPIGEYEQLWIAYNPEDPNDPNFVPDTVYCSFKVVIIENIQTTDILTCNDQVNISLDSACQLFIDPDMILEGGNYGCFDDFLVEVEGVGSAFGGLLVTLDEIDLGTIYTVKVTDTKTGINCWGTILIEDKLPPSVECQDHMIFCSTPIDPVFEDPGIELLPYAPVVTELCDFPVFDYEDEIFESECGIDSVYRSWTITDMNGNSVECLQVIRVMSAMSDSLMLPDNFIGDCNESIDPSVTGVPTIAGHPVVNNSQCNTVAIYHDIVFDDCGAATKIVRKWTVVLGCTGDVVKGDQVIKLVDDNGPGITCPEDLTFSTDPWTCVTDIIIPEPEVIDACGSDYTLSLDAGEFEVVGTSPFFQVIDVPFGVWPITWIAEDDCGNVSECTFFIAAVDDVPPVPICDAHTTIALGEDAAVNNGLTKLAAIAIDDGSYDNCGAVTFEARRMTSCIDFDWTTQGAGIDEEPNGIVNSADRGTAFREYVPFSCCDAGQGPIMVELRVEDEYGNFSSCMVEVEVEDKIAPVVQCPPEIVVSCEFWFAAEETNGFVDPSEDVLTPVFGTVLDAFDHEPGDRESIVIDDPGNDEQSQPYVWGLDGWADDNCDLEISVRVRIYDDCSGEELPAGAPSADAVRLIERTFLAVDNAGNSNTCVQRIWAIDFDPFYISDETCVNSDPNDGVIWPCDEEYETCGNGIDPNYPIIIEDNCDLIGVTYSDSRFDFVDNACYKILRTWKVINWCQFDAQAGTGYWEYTQVIKVIDTEPTDFTDCPQEPLVLCVADSNVSLPENNQVFLGQNNPLASSCSAHVTFSQPIFESCTDFVTYDVKVYPFNGSSFLQLVDETEVDLDTNHVGVLEFDTRTSTSLEVRQNGLPYNSPVCVNDEVEYHRILWTVRDGCGNVSTCEFLFRLEDCKAPSPVCLNLSTVVMPGSGEVTIWAEDFNASSFDDCTLAEDLIYGFSETEFAPSITINCDSIEANGGNAFLTSIWVADAGNDLNCDGTIDWSERNKDFCTVILLVDDNEEVCGEMNIVAGQIVTDELVSVEDVEVKLMDASDMMEYYMTEVNGMYYFPFPQPDYTVKPYKNDDPKNGVSTWDLITLMRHLTGSQRIDQPYRLIAADATNDSDVSALDILEIRRLLLGNIENFSNNTSWRFVDMAYEFIDPYEPWIYPESIDLTDGMSMHKDFIGVKIGDLNGSVTANAQQAATKMSNDILVLTYADKPVVEGDIVEVVFKAENFDQIYGYQFTMNTPGLRLMEILSGAQAINESNIGRHAGQIAFSWSSADHVTYGRDDVLFRLRLKANSNGNLSELLSVGSQVVESEAYRYSSNAEYESLDVVLLATSTESTLDPVQAEGPTPATAQKERSAEFALYQNAPNPFATETVISFDLPREMPVVLSIYNTQGQQVFVKDIDAISGTNSVLIDKDDIDATGVLLYKLEAEGFKATKKMVILD